MAPEQAAGKNKQVTTASDVYSLGAILYELLAGRPPFQADTPLETMRQVVELEPVPPRLVIRSSRRKKAHAKKSEIRPAATARQRGENPKSEIDKDLETICLKCLQKNPAQRYASAEALAEDLERWLRHEPIRARPSNVWEQGVKWARRHPARAGLVLLALVAPAAIIGVLMVSGANVRRERNLALQQEQRANTAATRAEAETRRATEAREETRQNLYAADMLLGQHALDDDNLGLARRLVLDWQPTSPNPSTPNSQPSTDLRGFEWRYLWKKCRGDQLHTLYGHSNGVHSVAFSRDGKVLASGDASGAVKLWDVASRRLFATLATRLARIVRVSFSADGRALATADEMGKVTVWNFATREAVWTHEGGNPEGFQLSPVGNLIGVTKGAVGGDNSNSAALVIDWTTGKEVLRAAPRLDFEAFSPDGKLAFITGPDHTEIWELENGRRVRTITNFAYWAFPSPDGRSLAELPRTGTEIALLDLTDHKPPALLRLSSGAVTSLAFSPDSTLLAGAGSGQVVRVWDAATQREVARLQGHVGAVTGVAFSPDGQLLATSSADHTVMLWPTTWQKNFEIISNAWGPFRLSPDGKTLATFDKVEGSKRILLWDVATHRRTELPRQEESLVPEFFSADSQTFFARGEVTFDGVLPLLSWNLNAPAHPPKILLLSLNNTNRVWNTAAAPDGRAYALWQLNTKCISLWNPLTGEAVGELHGPPNVGVGEPVRFSPDGRKLASHVWRNQIRLTDLATPDKVAAALLPVSDVGPTTFSPDGKLLAVPCGDHTIRLWDVATFKEVAILSGHQQAVLHVAFSPNGRTLASCSKDGTVKLWFWPARREVATLIRNVTGPHYVEFTPDGNTLLVGDAAGLVHIFRAPTLAEIDGKP